MFVRVSYKNPRVILLLYSFYLIVYLICISYFIYSYYIYLYLICISFDMYFFYIDIIPFIYIRMFISCDIPFIYIIIYNDYIWDKDYRMYSFIILWSLFFIDILFFMFCFWVGFWDYHWYQGFYDISFLCFVFCVYPYYQWCYYIRIIMLW